MQARWLHRKGSDRLIVFYAGWALGEADLRHMDSTCDVLMLHDYREERFQSADVAGYTTLDVVAYSMGVAVAARQMFSLRPRSMLALCGTVSPRQTIGSLIYDQTAEQLGVQSLARFARRAGANKPETPDIDSLREELLHLAKREPADPLVFNRVIGCVGDRIFTPDAMQRAWPNHRIRWLNGPHMPFQNWQTWQELLA